MKFCENCGYSLEKDDQFCPECGHPVKKVKNEADADKDNNIESTGQYHAKSNDKSQTQPKQNQQPKKPLTKKEKVKRGVLGAGLAAMVLAVWGFNWYFSPEKQENRLIDLVTEADASSLANYVTSHNPNFSVDTDQMTPYVNYLKETPELHSQIIRELKTTGYSHGLSIEPNGKKLWVDNYSLYLEPVYFNIKTNGENVLVSMEDAEIGTLANSNETFQVGPYVPGKYSFTGNGEIDGNTLQTTTTIDAFDSDYGSSHQVDLYLSGVSFEVSSNLADAEVYLNDQKIGDMTDGMASFGPLQYKDGMMLKLAYPLENGQLETEPVALSDYNDYYYLEFEDIVDDIDIENFLGNYYSHLSTMFADDDKRDQEKLKTYMVENENMIDTHNFFIEHSAEFRDSDVVDYVTFNVELKDVKMVGPNDYNVFYDVTYDINYTYDSDIDDREQVYSYDIQMTVGDAVRSRYDDKELFITAFNNSAVTYDSTK